MRRLAALLLLAVAVPLLAEPPAPSARQKDLIEQLLTLSHVDETVRLIVDSMLEQLGPTLDETRTAEGKQAIDRYRELVREKIDYKQFVRDVYGPLYAKYFTEEQLADLVVFYKSPTGQRMVTVLPQIERDAMKSAGEDLQEKFMAIARQVQEEQQQRVPWKSTMADMRSVAVAAEAWAVDHDDHYPPSKTWTELGKELVPAYIRELPQKDGWGNELAWIVSEDRKHYRIVSAGADKVFEADSRRIAAPTTNVKYSDRLEDDIVFADGVFVQAPRASQEKN
jgi:hypothetical protein